MNTKTCPVCGKPFTVPSLKNARKYCSPECKAEGHRRQARKRSMMQGHASPETWREFAGRPKVMTAADCKRCQTCIYRAKSHGSGLVTCDYLILTGEPRGCDVSETCGRYSPGKDAKR